MTALAADRGTKTAATRLARLRTLNVAAAVKIYAGAIVAMDTSGNARPGRTSTTDVIIGINDGDTVDNSAGIAGAKTIKVKAGVIAYFANHGADLVLQPDIGDDVFVVDDQTIAKTNGTSTRVRAGKLHELSTTDGVGVLFDT